MKSVSKTFTYKGYEFKIEVEFNTKTERRLNGKRWHSVATYSLKDNVVDHQHVEDSELEAFVIKKEEVLKNWVDERNTVPKNPLKHLGYK